MPWPHLLVAAGIVAAAVAGIIIAAVVISLYCARRSRSRDTIWALHSGLSPAKSGMLLHAGHNHTVLPDAFERVAVPVNSNYFVLSNFQMSCFSSSPL